jgi:septation ring formation regulator EzrA
VHDTEAVINQTLEEIRFRTSGSELFKYEGGKLKLRNLGKYINQKSISAKQIHTAFNELLSKLVEKIPDYEPKNFKAMIKIKSQEYSLDKVTGIYDNFKRIETEFKEVNKQIDKLKTDLKEQDDTNSMIMNEFKGFNSRITDIAKRVDGALLNLNGQESSKPTVDGKIPKIKDNKDKNDEQM